jgi:pilus assembly protein CpaE
MTNGTNILIASRVEDSVDSIAAIVVQSGAYTVAKNVMRNGHSDPLHGVKTLPDVLILLMQESSTAELDEYLLRQTNQRCPLIVIGPSHDPVCMRLAMQAGARDFLTEPLDGNSLLGAVERIVVELDTDEDENHEVIAFVNTKGGVGSSFLAANFAHACQSEFEESTVLIDLDRQFATLAGYLDVKIERGLSEAFESEQELDIVALDAFLSKHKSGLRLMGEKSDFFMHMGVIESTPLRLEQYCRLLDLLDKRFSRIIADVPRNLDALGVATLERADKIVLVVQQSVPCIRDAARMKSILTQNLNIQSSRIRLLVNRHQSNAAASISDICDALDFEDPILVPNHFPSASRSIDTGVPILESSPGSPISKALKKMEFALDGQMPLHMSNIFTRSISTFLRS